MSRLSSILDAGQQQLSLDGLLAAIQAEEAPTPEEVEAYCRECGGLSLPCLYRQTWQPGDGLLKHCPRLRTHYEREVTL